METDKSVQQMQNTGARVLQQSSGLPQSMVAASKTQPKAAAAAGANGKDEKDMKIADLMRQLEGERDKNRSLEDQYKFRIASFVKRETQTKNKIDSLERRLNEGTDQDEHMQRMAVIENMHKSVISGVECIQNNTAKILQDQERDLMRAFRARLQEVSKEVENQRSRKGEHSTELQARHRRVVAELLQAQELAQNFDRKNQQLEADKKRLNERLQSREDDRQALLTELVACRKEALRLKALCREGDAAAAADQPAPTKNEARRSSVSQKQIDQARMQTSQNKQYEREVRYREAVLRLKRMVEAERKQNKALRQQQAEILQQRTELEVLLRQCLDDVKAEIMRHRLEHDRKEGPGLPGPGQPVSSMSVHELTAQDRERVLELLLSQQRVVQLLYSRTFPEGPLREEASATPPKTGGGKEDDFSWLSDIIPVES
eukprot:TRINITY_DN5963_c0_g2_i1.p2 TRINITY_DN5963_c0_g2~~TRINITY_DN5963_c0_g2_i1.p2  ORF type:complete len:468 (+),score=133.49 TRINITY_DN5963_c0_g2_i1:111-1406(+)